jgi:hypothetical protein
MRAAFIGVLIFATILLFSCGESRTTKLSPHNTQTLSSALAELEKMAVPKGADPLVFEQLRSALCSALIARGDEKITSTPPTGVASTIPDLALADYGDGTMNLTWSYYSLGDYNQDGKVDVADITPLAMRYGQGWTTSDVNTLAAVADGSRNGTVDIADITQIAMYFGVEVDHYSVEVSPTAGSGYSELASQDITAGMGAATKRMHFAYNFTPTAGYWYRVVPHDSASIAGVASNEVQAAAAGTPAAPSDLAVSALSTTKIGLSWTDNSSDELGFRIERKEGAAGIWGEIDTTLTDITFYSDNGLTPATTYFYRVRAYNAAGNSLYSNEAYATTETSATAPDAPTGLSATAISISEIDLAWADNSPNEDGFRIERKEGAAGIWGVIATPAADATSYPDIGLASSTKYYYRVLAYNIAGDSAWSSEVNATTLADRTPWVHTFGGSSNDSSGWIKVDGNGNVYATGNTRDFGAGSIDMLMFKYSPDGTPLWRKTWGGTGDDVAGGICIDGSGNIYYSGRTKSFGIGGSDTFLLKRSSDGVPLWQKTWGGSGDETTYGVDVDVIGNVYVGGFTNSFGAAGTDAFLLKYASDGTLLWQRMWGGPGDEDVSGIAVDGSGNVFVTGRTNSVGFSAGVYDVFVLKFDTDGALLWQEAWGGAVDDVPGTPATDMGGNVYIPCGTSSFGVSPGSFDTAVLKLAPDGNVLWQKTWGGIGDDIAYGLSLDNSGNVWVTGIEDSFSVGAADVALLEYNSLDGTLLLQRTWGGVDYDYGWGITADNNGLVYLGGAALDALGSWQIPVGTENTLTETVAILTGTVTFPDGTENTLDVTETDVTGGVFDTGGGGYDALVIKVDPS